MRTVYSNNAPLFSHAAVVDERPKLGTPPSRRFLPKSITTAHKHDYIFAKTHDYITFYFHSGIPFLLMECNRVS